MRVLSILFIFLVLFSLHAHAQPPQTDVIITDTPPVDYAMPDTDDPLWIDEVEDPLRYDTVGVVFYPNFDEDSEGDIWLSAEDDPAGDTIPVETWEQMIYGLDSSEWVTYAKYFSIWSSTRVNPYHIDATEFNDTLAITLYDTINGLHWSMPLMESQITSGFGHRRYQWHYGTDLELDTGDPIVAAFDGVVRIQRYDPRGYGHYVLIRHYNGLETIYGHMSKPLVKVGQQVKAGELIGLGGSTGKSSGPHLHFEVRYEGNPIDPSFLYDFQHHKLRGQIFNLMPEHYAYLKGARRVYVHTVRSGDTLGSISRRYNVPVATICKFNGIRTTTPLAVGRKLRIR